MLRFFLTNHVFANLTFVLVLVLGFLAYGLLPRQQDPDMNFNWINVITALPGGSAEDVETLITEPLEEALLRVRDRRFVISSSQEGDSTILVRFQDMDEQTFDKRVNDLRREIRSKERELPPEAEDPVILEITSANGFPTAMVVVKGQADGENLRRQAHHVRKDLEQIRGVDQVMPLGLREPEIQIRFRPDALENMGVTPIALADTLKARFRDVSGGSLRVGSRTWLLRLQGTEADPERLARWPVLGPGGEVPLERVAEVARGRQKAVNRVTMDGLPAVLLPVTKQANANALELTARIRDYIIQRNALAPVTGVELVLADDATHLVRNALGVMENNALMGLILVMVTTWAFLGTRIAILIGLGIPFALAGTFGLIHALDGSLNVMVLLGVVIALGMLVDDAVVVVEAIHVRIQAGMDALAAGIEGLREVAAPVTTSVLTTMAAFLPLMLLPGILGKFMRVIPAVVSTALVLSLVEAFWILPAHVGAIRLQVRYSSPIHRWRARTLHAIRNSYVRFLVRVLRRPGYSLAVAILPFLAAAGLVAGNVLKVDFFAMDHLPLFYVNVEMPPGTPLDQTLAVVQQVEARVRSKLQPGEYRALVGYAGQAFTETKPLTGDRHGQVLVSLDPDVSRRRSVPEIMEGMRATVTGVAGPVRVTFLSLSGGPPVTKPVSIKVRGESYERILPAVKDLEGILAGMPAVRDIANNHEPGGQQLVLQPDGDAIRRAGLNPADVLRLVRLLGDGEVVARLQDQGEKVEVRVMAQPRPLERIGELLALPVARPGGDSIALGELLDHRVRQGEEAIRHHDFRRTITVEAELDQTMMNTVAANARIKAAWGAIQERHPGVNLDFSGLLDDITESLDAILVLFLLGVGLMYMILGAQFGSYLQPLLILTTLPMAFTGVVFGLLSSGHPLSLYTLYGVVALSGIAVNASIVLISAANDRRQAGMSGLHAIIFAGRRRVVPILITALTTIAGLFSLAMGWGGHSLLWGPVATAIVWGLGFSTLLTLFMMPLLYSLAMGSGRRAGGKRSAAQSILGGS
ncbi:MAG: efflux RND transporter permease subunit [Magnetococcales bacterium]|nr:efflux RND transporter permease subunit [Magnetococcales bacterium]